MRAWPPRKGKGAEAMTRYSTDEVRAVRGACEHAEARSRLIMGSVDWLCVRSILNAALSAGPLSIYSMARIFHATRTALGSRCAPHDNLLAVHTGVTAVPH